MQHLWRNGLVGAIALSGLVGLAWLSSASQSVTATPVTAAQATEAIEDGEIAPSLPLTSLDHWPDTALADDLLWQGDASAAQLRLLTAIAHSLSYLDTPAAREAYANYPIEGLTRDRVRRSLQRFRTLVLTSASPAELHAAVQREFELYQSIGNDGAGTVHFTGYFEPTYAASRVPTAEYRYPLYQRPADLEEWTLPHPTRTELEGKDGLQSANGPLKGLELVWMRDRLEAFLVQVQGSARLRLADGSFMSVGYAGRTEYDYVSLGRELINDGQVPAEGMTLERLLAFFAAHPATLSEYIPRNDRFVFFRATAGGPPTGTFSVPVTAGRSIATDKAIMPPGALALITLDWPIPGADGDWQATPISRYVLNQDTGGAIQGPGRVDIYVGSGDAAGAQAGQVNTDGQLFFLLLKE
ncbi:murein transglycosylase A [Halomicronema sp. CCY15110]|uniref:murein transglycosylase A n=1 Tax=Halomicronema sp. CCY15110 TaxID=2767773 RepID=UPI00194F42A7|nr:MltA domain-containing protein [Halomicronema sp. CCY15110]